MTLFRGGLLVLGVVGLGVACSDSLHRAPPLFSEANNVERVRSSVVFDTVWAVGGPDDTLLASPAMPRHDGALGVVFFDFQTKKASRIGADGDVLWSWGREGEGPGEIKNVRAMDVRDDGSVVLVDSGNRRLLTLSPGGELLDEVSLAGTGSVQSAAALSEGTLALHSNRAVFAIWSAEGGVVEAAAPAGLGELRLLQHQGNVTRWRDRRWVFGFGVGNGWLVFDGSQLAGTYPYVAHSEFPEIRYVRQGLSQYWYTPVRPPSSGRSLSVLADTLFVLFGGQRFAGRTLDKYDLSTGKYVDSDLLPHYANRAVVGSDRLFTVNSSALFPSIVALKRRASSEVIETG